MAISSETASWLEGLKKEGKLSDEVLAGLKTAAESSDLDTYIKGSVLRQSDYSRGISEVQKAQAELIKAQELLKEKEDGVTKFQTELGTWYSGAEANYNKALKDREAAERKTGAAVAKLKNLALASGMSEDDVLGDLDVIKVETKPTLPEGFDPSQYLTKADAARVTSESAKLDALIYDLGEEHRELFGTRLPNAQGLVEEALKSGLTLKEFWSQKYKVPDKRKENDEKAIQARIDAAVTVRENSIRSAGGLPQPRPELNNNPYNKRPLFDNTEIMKGAHNDTANSSPGVSAAIAASLEGKYSTRYGNVK